MDFRCGHPRIPANTTEPHPRYPFGRCRICIEEHDDCLGCGWWPMSSLIDLGHRGPCANCRARAMAESA